MKTKFRIEKKDEFETVISCPQERYFLQYKTYNYYKFRFTSNPMGKRVLITSRDLDHRPEEDRTFSDGDHYSRELTKIALNPDPSKTYLEVGSGLGEFSIVPGIIVVDTANFQLMREMLQDMRQYVDAEHITRLDELVSRCNRILNPSQVRLFNMTLGEAVKTGQLDGIADLVVDNCGAQDFSKVESCNMEGVIEMEGTLLKEGGFLFTEAPVYKKEKGVMRKVQ